MSITFYTVADRCPPDSACLECGGRSGAGRRDCPACFGYGGSTAVEQAWASRVLNVANSNAAALCAALGLDPEGGTIEAWELRARLAQVSWERLLQPNQPIERVQLGWSGVDVQTIGLAFGRTAQQVQSYRERLERLCSLAEQTGDPIVWS